VTNARVPSSRSFSTLVQGFFCQRLLQQRNASPRTVAAYRDTFRLLLCYVQDHRNLAIESVTLRDLDAVLVCAFLDYLEQERHNSIRTRNARLAALRSFFHYAATQAPEDLPNIQRVLAISGKRYDTPLLGFLTHQEVGAVRNACDLSTWSGRRDHALFTTLYNTGARVSEAINLRVVSRDTLPLRLSICAVRVAKNGWCRFGRAQHACWRRGLGHKQRHLKRRCFQIAMESQ